MKKKSFTTVTYDLADKNSKDYSVKITYKISKKGIIKVIKVENIK